MDECFLFYFIAKMSQIINTSILSINSIWNNVFTEGSINDSSTSPESSLLYFKTGCQYITLTLPDNVINNHA